MRAIKYILLCLIFIFPFELFSDYLKVSRSATIKDQPNSDATVLIRPEVDSYLDLLDEGKQENGYYRVKSNGAQGWIYRTLVRRYSGKIPTSVSKEVNLLQDPTYSLNPELIGYASKHLAIGKPQALYERVHQGYVLAEDPRLKIPVWVQYVLTCNDLIGNAKRKNDFRPDTSIPFDARAELSDYSGSGFDRGHMAPAGDMTRSTVVMSESFLLSNTAPQVDIGFNRGVWVSLEKAVRGWVEQRGTLTVITGPVFAIQNDKVCFSVIGEHHVAVPTHFFKIIVDVNDLNNIQALAFLIPNENLSGHSYSEYLTSIDSIETDTGLDFLSKLPEKTQAKVESMIPDYVW